MQEIGVTAVVAFGTVVLFLLAWRAALWNRRRVGAAGAPASPQTASPLTASTQTVSLQTASSNTAEPPVAAAGAEPLALDPASRRLERRMEEIEAIQADLAERFAELAEGGGAGKLQAMAGSLLNLVRDKDATLETALAGLDGLRARLKTLEGIGDLAEARTLFDGLTARLDALEAVGGAAPAAAPVAELAESLAALHRQKEAAIEAVLARLGPLEAKLGEVEGRIAGLDPRGALDRFGARLDAVRTELAARIESGIESGSGRAEAGPDPVAEIAEGLARLHAQKDATVETVLARLGPLEAGLAAVESRLGGLAPQAAVERFGERLEAARTALEAQIAGLRGQAAPAAPLAELSETLARLAAGKDAALETVLGRLGPLEAALGALEGRVAGLDPAAALARFAERLEAVQGRLAELGERDGELDRRLGRMEGAEDPVAAIAARFAELQDRKDATTETVLARLGPLEAGLAALEARLAAADPAGALARLDARLTDGLEAVGARIAALDAARAEAARTAEAGREDAAALLARLDRLGAEREAALAALAARLGASEARMADLEAVAAAGAAASASLAALAADLAALRGEFRAGGTATETRLAALGETLAGLDGRGGAAAEAAAARLAALEAAQAGTEGRLAALDPEAAFARLEARLDALRERMGLVEEGGRAPVAELAAEFGRFRADKETGLAALLGRLAPLEAKLAGIETRLGTLAPAEALARFAERVAAAEAAGGALEDRLAGRLAALDPAAALARIDERLEALRARMGTVEEGARAPLAELAAEFGRLHADKEAGLAAVFGRVAPLEAKLAGIEARLGTLAPAEALARFAERVVAAEAAGAALETRLAGRLEVLERPADPLAEDPLAALREEIAGLRGARDAALDAVAGRLGRLEAELGALETRTLGEAEARAEAQAIAAEMVAARTVAEETRLFANRISLLEASLPRLTLAQSLMMQALESQSAPWPPAEPVPSGLAGPTVEAIPPVAPAPAATTSAAELDAIWRNPRVISLHQAK